MSNRSPRWPRRPPIGGIVVIARTDELAVLSAFVTDAARRPGVLVIDGEGGVGKTTLLEFGVAEAIRVGHRVLSASPAEPDSELAFAVLGDLLGPLMPSVREFLPDPQRHALSVALLEEEGTTATDPRAVSAGVLTALRKAAEDAPLLIAIDDAQWIDLTTDRALAFAFRRIGDVPLGVVLARRSDPDGGSALQIERAFRGRTSRGFTVGPLDAESLASIIERELGSQPSRREARDIHAQSGGNPFYAVELARAAQRGDERPTGLSLPIPKGLREDIVRGRFAELAPSTIELLLFASAASRPTAELIRAAMPTHPVDQAIEEAERAALLRVDRGELRFTHPLLRAAAYADASRTHRHRVHATIARVVSDPEERGRHLALSADDPDQAIAREIEEAAAQARARGAPETAADLLTHAIRLTPLDDRASLSRRLLAAGGDRFLAGDAVGGSADASRAADLAAPGPDRAHALAHLGQMESLSRRDTEARAHLEAALEEPNVTGEIRCRIHADLFWTVLHFGDVEAAAVHAKRARELADGIEATAARARAYAAAAHAKMLRVGGLADDLLAEAPELWGPIPDLPMSDWPAVTLAGDLVAVGQFERGRVLVSELLEQAEARGDDIARQQLLARLAELLLQTGGWDEGLKTARASRDLEMQVYGTASTSARVAWFEGALGDVERARAEVDRALEGGRDRRWTKRWAGRALGMIELSLGRPREAAAHLESLGVDRPPMGSGDPGLAWSFLPDLLESLAAEGRIDEAEEHVRWLEERGNTLGRPSALATGARGRGLIDAARGDLEAALGSLETAVQEHDRLTVPYELARSLLSLGSIRRRAGRKRLAREALDRAGSIFEELGAVNWGHRVESELGRITGRRPSAGRLTDVERRVAGLAAAGFRNREIAQQLYMSVRTVEGHLSDVYAKLGIRSRTELVTTLDVE